MTPDTRTPEADAAELSRLITVLTETYQRIAELTGGQVDAVMGSSGVPTLLPTAQTHLRESEAAQRLFAEELQGILDAMSPHIAVLNSSGIIVTTNLAWKKFGSTNGFADDHLGVGDSYLRVCEPIDGTSSNEANQIAQALRVILNGTQQRFVLEYACHAPTGHRWFQFVAEPIMRTDGPGAVVLHIDITERKLAEEKTEEMKNRLETLVAAAPIGIMIHLDFKPVIVNEKMVRIFGYRSVPDFLDMPNCRILLDEESLQRIDDNHLRRLKGDPVPESYLLKGRRQDGSNILLETRGTIIRWGDRTAVAVMMIDVTDQEAQREQLSQNAALLDKANDAITVRSIDGIVTFWNKAAERIYGWTAAEAIGRAAVDLVQADMSVFEPANRFALENGHWRGQLAQRRKDGRAITMQAAWSVLRDDEGNPKAILSINTDITEQLMLQEQLRQAQRLEAIGQLTGGMAHDFNNLLTIILGNAEILTESLAGDPQLRHLAEVTVTAAERGAELTNRLLAFARRQPLNPQPTDINTLVASMDDLLHRTLGGQISVELHCADDLWNAMVDKPQLESALLNLSINARDAMPLGGKLTFTTANIVLDPSDVDQGADAMPGDYVMISVSDTGSGMTPEVLKRAFDPFFTTKDVGKGSGLGLSMVFGFIKQSKGHIKIVSKVGRGTTVKLYVPKSSAAADVRGRDAASVIHGGSERILYVEDNELVRDHVTAQLITLGYDVVVANDGPEAISLLKNVDGFDLLFTDIIMPGGLNGRELADKAKQFHPDLAVLFTSGYNENAIIMDGRLIPGTQLLSKPFRFGDLAQKLRFILDSPGPHTH